MTIGRTTGTATTLIQGSNSATAIQLQTATGGTIGIGTSGVANTVQIGNTSGAVTQTINIGNNATASSTNNVTIGSIVAGTIALQGTTTVTNRTTGTADTLIVSNNGASQNIFVAKDSNSANAVLTIADAGAVTFRNQTDSTTALLVQNAAGITIFNIDTTDSRVGTSNVSGAGTNSQAFVLRTGNATGTGSSNSGNVVIRSGNSTNANTGNVELDVGAAGGTPGSIYLGSNYVASSINIGQVGSNAINSTVNIATATNGTQSVTIGSTSTAGNSLTLQAGSSGGITVNGTTNFNGNLLPNVASSRDLGSATLEFDELYLGDNNGLNLGLDQDATLAYDEATDDRVELTGSGASLFIEDRLGLGRQTFTMSTAGAATENLTPTASYVEITGQDNAADIVQIQTASAKEGDTLIITNIDSINVSIDQNATTKLSGGADVLLTQYDVMMLIYDGTNWLQVSAVTNNS